MCKIASILKFLHDFKKKIRFKFIFKLIRYYYLDVDLQRQPKQFKKYNY